jgi:hypothetical protein
MVTKLKTIHEEEYSDKSKIIGVFLNYSESGDYKDSFIYVFNQNTKIYVFFTTIVDAIDYLMWADSKVKRAYLEEWELDQYLDNDINGTFNSKLTWSEQSV